MFSSRTPLQLTSNKLTQVIEQKYLKGEEILDLTQSNPTRIDIDYPKEEILAALTSSNTLLYNPDPKGLATARDAVIGYYKNHLIDVDRERIYLTASTSEAYTILFKLLMEPGDSVLVPTPSYPLFEHLAQVECVKHIGYPLYFDGMWYIDFPMLEKLCQKNTRAIVIVNPNNPTGSFLKQSELSDLIRFCKEHNLALISDEVFCDYAHENVDDKVRTVAEISDVLTFTLNGLSKYAGLPQLKLGWIVINGSGEVFQEASSRLEFITDLFLSVSSPVQHALGKLLEIAPKIKNQIHNRVIENLNWLKEQISRESVCNLLTSEGGWYAILKVPKIIPEEELILELLIKDNLIVHPGYFFDFQMEGHLIVSLITKKDIFQLGIKRLLSRIELIK